MIKFEYDLDLFKNLLSRSFSNIKTKDVSSIFYKLEVLTNSESNLENNKNVNKKISAKKNAKKK